MNKCYDKDMYRYFGNKKLTLVERIILPPEIRYIKWFRKTQNCSDGIRKRVLSIMMRFMQNRTQISIPIETQIGEGFYIGHTGRVIISPKTIIGKNVNVATGVTIGGTFRGDKQGFPIIADNVWIGTNAVIVGNIKIGTDVLIAPLAYVNFDVPEHSIVIGNPGKIIHKEEATSGYINNTV